MLFRCKLDRLKGFSSNFKEEHFLTITEIMQNCLFCCVRQLSVLSIYVWEADISWGDKRQKWETEWGWTRDKLEWRQSERER